MQTSSFHLRPPRPATGRLARARDVAVAAGLAAVVVAAMAGPAAGASRSSSGLTWSVLSPPASPRALSGASEAYDSADGSIVLFGGQLASGRLSDQTWVWNGSAWSDPETFGASPPARELASMAFDPYLNPPQLVLYGGRAPDGTLLDDTWTWNGSSWNELTTSTSPGGRDGAALTADTTGHLVLFGGYGTTSASGATPPTTTTTTAPPSSTTTTTTPPPPTSTTTTTTTTTSPSSSTTTAASATGAASTGTAATGAPTKPTTHTSRPTSTDRTTTRPTTPAEHTTPTTTGSAAGATRLPQVLGDTWILGSTRDGYGWREVTAGPHPPATTEASLATDPSGTTVLFGGTARQPGHGQNAGVVADTWIWDGGAWRRAKGGGPPARQDATMAYDADLGATVLTGGLGAHGALSDTWLWNGSAWRHARPTTSPTARSAAAGAYDPGSRQLVMFGGTGATGAPLSTTVVLTGQAPTRVPSSSSTSTTVPATRTGPTGPARHPHAGATSTPTSTPAPTSGSSTSPTTAPPSITVHRGDVVTLTGAGFLPHARITITFHSTPVTVGSILADAGGSFRVTVVVPTEAAIGDHHFDATGMGPDGLTSLITPIRVVALSTGHHTSVATKGTLVAIALGIPVASWAVLGVVSRRRRRVTTA